MCIAPAFDLWGQSHPKVLVWVASGPSNTSVMCVPGEGIPWIVTVGALLWRKSSRIKCLVWFFVGLVFGLFGLFKEPLD